MSCVLKEFGCIESIVPTDTEKHYLTIQHQQAMINCLHSKSTTMNDSNAISTAEQDVYKNMEVIVDTVETLVSDTLNLKHMSFKLKSDTNELKQKLEELKSSVEEDRSFVEGTESNRAIHRQEIASLQNQIEDMSVTSYDGSYIWKIASFREKMSKYTVLVC